MDFSIANSEDRWAHFWRDVGFVTPEIMLAIGMCAVIIVPFFRRNDARLPALTALISLGFALVGTFITFKSVNAEARTLEPIFHGMLAIDPFSQFFKMLLIVFTILVVVQWFIVRDRDTNAKDVPDFMCLLLGATFGMSLMASANNLLMIFLAMEAASFPSFALAGFRKNTRIGTEGALKYVIFGAASSAIMVYGMSLVFGASGSLNLGVIASNVASAGGISPLMAVGLLGMFAGIAFKLSAVPLHFWCPDVFQGSPIEVTTFLSVASKGAAVVMLVRVLAAFGFAVKPDSTLFFGIATGVGILGGVTATWGNLVAYHQTNIKRLLAYSSIAHAGYMIMAASVIVLQARAHGGGVTVSADHVAGAILFYVLIYLFMNLGAFTIAALIAQRTGSEDIRDYANLRQRSPLLAWALAICLLSLFGMPGLGGFWAKVFILSGMVKVGWGGIVLVAVLLVNTLMSFFYYMRPIVIMTVHKDEQDRPSFVPRAGGVGLVYACIAVLVITGIVPGVAQQFTNDWTTIIRTQKTGEVQPSTAVSPQHLQDADKSVSFDVSAVPVIANELNVDGSEMPIIPANSVQHAAQP